MSVVTRDLISSDQRSGVDIGKGGREGMRYNGTLNECAPTRGRWRNALMKIKIDDENKILSLCDISCPCTNKRRILMALADADWLFRSADHLSTRAGDQALLWRQCL